MNLQWLQSDEAEKFLRMRKLKPGKILKGNIPFADLSKFEAQTDFNDKKHATADIKFKSWSWFLAKRFRIRQKILVR